MSQEPVKYTSYRNFDKPLEFTSKDIAKCYGKRTFGGVARLFSRLNFYKTHGSNLTKKDIQIGLDASKESQLAKNSFQNIKGIRQEEAKPRKITKESDATPKINETFFKQIEELNQCGIEELIKTGPKKEMNKSEKKEISEFLKDNYPNDMKIGLEIANKLFDNGIEINVIEFLFENSGITLVNNSIYDIIKLYENKILYPTISFLINAFPNNEVENYISLDDIKFLSSRYVPVNIDGILKNTKNIDKSQVKKFLNYVVSCEKNVQENGNKNKLNIPDTLDWIRLCYKNKGASDGSEQISVFQDYFKLYQSGIGWIDIQKILSTIERNEMNVDSAIKLHNNECNDSLIPSVLELYDGPVEDVIKLARKVNPDREYDYSLAIYSFLIPIDADKKKGAIDDVIKLIDSKLFHYSAIVDIINKIPKEKRDIDRIISEAKAEWENYQKNYENQDYYKPTFTANVPEDLDIPIPKEAATLSALYEEYKKAKENNNYAGLFGLEKNYTQKDAEDAFKKKFSLKLHPDKNKEFSKEAEGLFKLFKDVRDYLISEQK